MIVDNRFTPLLLIPWSILWAIGGIWLASSVFSLRPNEKMTVGIVVGWLAQNWLANLLAWVFPIPLTFWLAAVMVFAAGFMVCLRSGWKSLFRVDVNPGQVVLFAAIILVYFSIGRGMAIFDDFQHLATISVMASGDIPPHFALDPQVVFGYHHFLQLFAAQIVRIGGLAPWIAVDAARALSFGGAVMLGVLWTQSVTSSRVAGLFAGLVVAFGSGTRWLLLFLPQRLLEWLGQNLQMIGSGAASGASLAEALGNAWAVEGGGAIPFPFAFSNGILPPGVIQGLTANSLTGLAILFLLLLLSDRITHWMGPVLLTVFIAIWGLVGEAELVVFAAGCGLVAAVYMVSNRTIRLPASLWAWLGIAASGCLIGILEGGAWTDILLKAFQKLSGESVAASYQTIGFQLTAPAVVSSHLGILPILRPGSLLVALCELGPLLAVLPLTLIWGWKAFRKQRWLEVSLVAMGAVSLLMLFVQFTGSTGVRNTPRLYVFAPVLLAFSTALVWMWLRERSARIRSLSATLGVVVIAGGMVMFGIELVAMQRPVYSYFISALDARMARAYWNQLEPDALIFDPTAYRAPALFGRATDAYLTWYLPKPEWTALRASPRPSDLSAAGFQYVYLDNLYWNEIGPQFQQEFAVPCVKMLQEWDDPQGNFRRLFDIRACR